MQCFLLNLNTVIEAVLMMNGFHQSLFDILLLRLLDFKQMTAGTDGGIDGMQRIAGGCADQGDITVFHMWEQKVLLILVQPMHLINDHDQSLVKLCLLKYGFQILLISGYCIKHAKRKLQLVCEHHSQCCFTGTGRSIENHGE